MSRASTRLISPAPLRAMEALCGLWGLSASLAVADRFKACNWQQLQVAILAGVPQPFVAQRRGRTSKLSDQQTSLCSRPPRFEVFRPGASGCSGHLRRKTPRSRNFAIPDQSLLILPAPCCRMPTRVPSYICPAVNPSEHLTRKPSAFAWLVSRPHGRPSACAVLPARRRITEPRFAALQGSAWAPASRRSLRPLVSLCPESSHNATRCAGVEG